MATTEERLKQYEDLYAKAAAYDPTQYAQDFKKAYGEATEYNKDLIGQQSQALGELQAVSPTLREKYANSLIVDPTRQLSLIAQARQAPLTSYSQAANLLTARGNKYSDILGKAVNAYTQEQTSAQNAAENAWRLYQDAVSQDQYNRSLRAQSSGGFDLRDLIDTDNDGIPDYKDTTPSAIPGTDDGQTYHIPTSQQQPQNISSAVTNSLAKGILEYQNAPNALQKYLQLQKGSALSSLAGLPGLASYLTAVTPSVWSDIKGLFNRAK